MRELRDQTRSREAPTIQEIFNNLKDAPPQYKKIIESLGPAVAWKSQSDTTPYNMRLEEALLRPNAKGFMRFDLPAQLASLPEEKQVAITADFEAQRKYIREHIEGAVLVDLGNRNMSMRGVADEFGAKGFIAVDKFIENDAIPYDPTKNQIDALTRLNAWRTKPAANEAFVRADMLDFVSRLPDNSVNFTMSGIDRAILYHRDDSVLHEYCETLAAEMFRATKKNGLIFGRHFPSVAAIFGSWEKQEGKRRGEKIKHYELLGLKEYHGKLLDKMRRIFSRR